ncbi:MAG: hypothetical protein IPP47_09040 [Bryobacterales bacterium]|nr:hypothetical protein [Bryobacterales bacterium]
MQLRACSRKAHSMAIAKLERQQVIGALKATGSSDPDVLYARKEELLAPSRSLKLLGIAPIIVGIAMSLTIIGAVVGIPAILFGLFIRKRIRANIGTAESALSEYSDTLRAKAQAAAV